jgi:repressor LexA
MVEPAACSQEERRMEMSKRQNRIVDYIRSFILDNGYPPSIRQIGEAVGISSTSVVNYNLNILQKAGYLSRDRTVSRGIKMHDSGDRPRVRTDVISVPLLGRIAAGEPIPVPEGTAAGDTLEITRDLVPSTQDIYALQVRGNSMIDALINDGDVVVMQYQQTANNGDMVAAWLVSEESTTLKRYFHEGNRIRLQPENTQMEPIYVDPNNLQIQGRVVAVIRRLN